MKLINEALTFDDVLLKPQYSEILSRKDVNIATHLTAQIKLNIPIISANMDSVTESSMAIAMAKLGGIGIIHRFLPIEQQVNEVKKVKRNEGLKIDNPVTILADKKVGDVINLMHQHNISGLLVVDEKNRLKGIITRRDLHFVDDNKTPLKKVMTVKVITAPPNISIDEAKLILQKHKIEKLPLVNKDKKVQGLITLADIVKKKLNPQATLDKKGRLRVGAAVGVRTESIKRAQELVKAGVDVLVVDIAHGHSKLAVDMVKNLKRKYDLQIIAGNVATSEGTRDLIKAGADAVKVGIGPGSICTTRLVTGFGVPQISAIQDCFKISKQAGIPLIADGGIRRPGDLLKALAAGASSVMMGSVLASTYESPGILLYRNGLRYKVTRGMASLGANLTQQQSLGNSKDLAKQAETVTPEGVEAMIPYRGKVREVLREYIGGLRSGLSYGGACSIPELQKKAEFIKITNAGLKESFSHDVDKI